VGGGRDEKNEIIWGCRTVIIAVCGGLCFTRSHCNIETDRIGQKSFKFGDYYV